MQVEQLGPNSYKYKYATGVEALSTFLSDMVDHLVGLNIGWTRHFPASGLSANSVVIKANTARGASQQKYVRLTLVTDSGQARIRMEVGEKATAGSLTMANARGESQRINSLHSFITHRYGPGAATDPLDQPLNPNGPGAVNVFAHARWFIMLSEIRLNAQTATQYGSDSGEWSGCLEFEDPNILDPDLPPFCYTSGYAITGRQTADSRDFEEIGTQVVNLDMVVTYRMQAYAYMLPRAWNGSATFDNAAGRTFTSTPMNANLAPGVVQARTCSSAGSYRVMATFHDAASAITSQGSSQAAFKHPQFFPLVACAGYSPANGGTPGQTNPHIRGRFYGIKQCMMNYGEPRSIVNLKCDPTTLFPKRDGVAVPHIVLGVANYSRIAVPL